MALCAAVHGGHGGGVEIVAPGEADNIVDQPLVAAAVAGKVGAQSTQIHGLHLTAEALPVELQGLEVAPDLALGAHHMDLAGLLVGEAGHLEGGGHAVLKLEVDGLVVHHVVVHLVDAAAIVGGGQHLVDPLQRGLRMQNGGGPAGQTGRVEAACVGRTVQLTVSAAVSSALGAVFLPEVGQGAEGGDLHALLADEPQQDIHIVAALGQDHGAGLGLVVPVAADVAVAVVVEAHLLDGLNSHHIAHSALFDQALDLLVEHGVAQHVADEHPAAHSLGSAGDLHHVSQLVGNGLLQHQVIAQRHSLQGVLLVLRVLGGDDHVIGQPGLCQNGVCAVKEHILAQVQIFVGSIQADTAVVSHCHDLCLLRILHQLGSIGGAAVAHAENCKGYLTHKNFLQSRFFPIIAYLPQMSLGK